MFYHHLKLTVALQLYLKRQNSIFRILTWNIYGTLHLKFLWYRIPRINITRDEPASKRILCQFKQTLTMQYQQNKWLTLSLLLKVRKWIGFQRNVKHSLYCNWFENDFGIKSKYYQKFCYLFQVDLTLSKRPGRSEQVATEWTFIFLVF